MTEKLSNIKTVSPKPRKTTNLRQLYIGVNDEKVHTAHAIDSHTINVLTGTNCGTEDTVSVVGCRHCSCQDEFWDCNSYSCPGTLVSNIINNKT